jgi:hypothetical protein
MKQMYNKLGSGKDLFQGRSQFSKGWTENVFILMLKQLKKNFNDRPRAVYLNRRALVPIIPGRERFSWNF